MKTIAPNDVFKIYNAIKNKAKKAFEKGDYINSQKFIEVSAIWMYQFNCIYTDPETERLIHKVAELKLPKKSISNPKCENVVFIDYFGLDNRGLTQQYLRGLMAAGKRILYILHNRSPINNSEIIHELNEYKKSEILIITTSRNNIIEVSSQIANEIFKFQPNDLFMHIAPWDVVTLLAISTISGVIKYNINLTDHAFWLGTTFVDYNIEFRGYGETLSIQKRGLKQSQLISLPYYPIVSKFTKFQGFPKLPDDSIIVLCGGAEYKMLGKDRIFFRLMSSILNISSKVQILVAGIEKTSLFAKNVFDLCDYERVHFLGDRKDINEVFAHSDIYLSSYPFIGGLMAQFAAYNKLPILAYAEENEIGTADSLINHFGIAMQTKRSINNFLGYAELLIKNKAFRIEEGNKCKSVMIDEEKFNTSIERVLNCHITDIRFEKEQADYESMTNYYLEIENLNHNAIKQLIYSLKTKALFLMPKYFLHITSVILNVFMKKTKKSFSSIS